MFALCSRAQRRRLRSSRRSSAKREHEPASLRRRRQDWRHGIQFRDGYGFRIEAHRRL